MSVDPYQKYSELIDQSNRTGIAFLLTDLGAALTFIQVAETSSSPETRVRNYGKALEGYRTVLRFLPRLLPSAEELEQIQHKLEQIRLLLEQAGYLVAAN
jgi:hypothetical protein